MAFDVASSEQLLDTHKIDVVLAIATETLLDKDRKFIFNNK